MEMSGIGRDFEETAYALSEHSLDLSSLTRDGSPDRGKAGLLQPLRGAEEKHVNFGSLREPRSPDPLDKFDTSRSLNRPELSIHVSETPDRDRQRLAHGLSDLEESYLDYLGRDMSRAIPETPLSLNTNKSKIKRNGHHQHSQGREMKRDVYMTIHLG